MLSYNRCLIFNVSVYKKKEKYSQQSKSANTVEINRREFSLSNVFRTQKRHVSITRKRSCEFFHARLSFHARCSVCALKLVYMSYFILQPVT